MTPDQRRRYDLLAHIIATTAVHGSPPKPAWREEYLQLHALYQEWLDGDAA